MTILVSHTFRALRATEWDDVLARPQQLSAAIDRRLPADWAVTAADVHGRQIVVQVIAPEAGPAGPVMTIHVQRMSSDFWTVEISHGVLYHDEAVLHEVGFGMAVLIPATPEALGDYIARFIQPRLVRFPAAA